MIVKDFLLYGLSAGLNRAGIFLLLPFSAMYIPPAAFGELNLYLISSSLLSVLFTLNISVVISREYYIDRVGVMRFVRLHNFVILSLLTLFLFLTPLFYNVRIFWFVGFVLSECLFLVNSNYIRFKCGPSHYFKLTSFKFIFLILTFIFCVFYLDIRGGDLVTIVMIVVFFSNLSFLFVGFDLRTLLKPVRVFGRLKFRFLNYSYLLFALTLIPHSAAQWISSSFDRFFVNWFFTDNELGIYSFSYSLASLLLLVSSSYALGLPQLCVKNYKLVGSKFFFRAFLILNSVLLFSFLYAVKFALPYFSDYNDANIFEFVVIVSCGLYFLFFYLYFSSSLFYERRGRLISKITFVVCVYSVGALYPMASYFGIIGVCIVTLSAYLLYMCLVAYFSEFANLKRVFLPVAFSFFTITFFIDGSFYV
ncbi:hypothetical protein A1OK_22115 [Enterovibrio norvegicus FF-454]|uniref:Polysaccharide biosynthesis protein n=1 Tax=Enterovibrio norvegicus FF-454 TaxID=1185651 RepID=A0A1E5C6N3_9GAMM|nr:hypothetical protein [Enterovibrio norvegicus]OEE61107.1 hypothetical protein A1OK_22115 [Enterovibrio norvegicus FF-454]